MGKNKGLGGRKRRQGKHEDTTVRETIFKEDCMDYGYIIRALGSGRFEVYCNDDKTRLGILRGNMRRKTWICTGDMILYGIREFQASKVDILHKYINEDVQKLYRYDEITKKMYKTYTSDIHNNSSEMIEDHDENVAFMHDDIDDINDTELEKEGDDLGDWKRVNSNHTLGSKDDDLDISAI
jgi:translation initiation factor 1A